MKKEGNFLQQSPLHRRTLHLNMREMKRSHDIRVDNLYALTRHAKHASETSSFVNDISAIFSDVSVTLY